MNWHSETYSPTGLLWLVSTYVVCERLSVMHKQVSGWTVNFVQILQKAPFWNFRPSAENEKLQIWDDQSLLQNTPHQMKNFRFEMTKVYSGIPPPNEKLPIWDDQSLLRNTPPQWKTSDLRWPKFTLKYPPPLKWKTSDLRWPKFTLKYPPPQFGIREIVCGD